MRERVGDGDVSKIGAAAKGAAGGGDDEALDRAGLLAVDQLVERRVLGVDRQQPGAGRLGQRHHQLPAEHQALLVGERDVDSGGEREHGRAEPGGADDPVEDEVGIGCRDQLAHTLLADEHAPLPRRSCLRRGLRVGKGDRADAVLARLATVVSQPRPAAKPTARSSSEAPITSSACVPIDPVEPSISTFLIYPEDTEATFRLNKRGRRRGNSRRRR